MLDSTSTLQHALATAAKGRNTDMVSSAVQKLRAESGSGALAAWQCCGLLVQCAESAFQVLLVPCSPPLQRLHNETTHQTRAFEICS
jgi:hypothetical protein